MGKVSVNTADFESISQFLTDMGNKLSNVYSMVDYVENRIDYRVRNECSQSFSVVKSLVEETNNKNSKVVERSNLICAVYGSLENNLLNKQNFVASVASKVQNKTDGLFDKAIELFGDAKEKLKETGAEISDDIKSFLEGTDEKISDALENIVDFLGKAGKTVIKVKATVDAIRMSLLEGLAGLVEKAIDVGAVLTSVSRTWATLFVDGLGLVYSKFTGNEWNSVTKQMWDRTMSFVAKEYVQSGFDYFYENTKYGKFIKNNAYYFDKIRNTGTGLGTTVGILALSFFTAGLGPVALGGIAAFFGFGEGVEKAWKESAGLVQGLLYGTAFGAWQGIEFGIGSKIGGSNIFGSASGAVGKILNSGARVGADALDGGLGGFIQPALEMIYKFDSSNSLSENYKSLFDDAGGFQNVFTQAFIGGGLSFLGEAFDLNRVLRDNKSSADKISSKEVSKKIKDTTSSFKEKITPFKKIGDMDNLISKANDATRRGKFYKFNFSSIDEIPEDFWNKIENPQNIYIDINNKIMSFNELSIFSDIVDRFHNSRNSLYKESKKILKGAIKGDYKGLVSKKAVKKSLKKVKFFDTYDDFWEAYRLKNGTVDESLYLRIGGVAYPDEILIPPNVTVNEVIHEINHQLSRYKEFSGLTEYYFDDFGNRIRYDRYNEGVTEYFANKLSGHSNRGYPDVVEKIATLDDILTMVYGENNGILKYEYFNQNPKFTKTMFEHYLGEGSYDKFIQHIEYGCKTGNTKTNDIEIINWNSQQADEMLNDLIDKIYKQNNFDENRFFADVDDDLLTLAKARLSEADYLKYVKEANEYGYISKKLGNKFQNLFKDVGYSKSLKKSLGYEIGIHNTGYLDVDESVLDDIFNKGLINNGHSMGGAVLTDKIPDLSLTVTKTNDFVDFINRIKKANKYKNSQGSIIFKIPDGMSSRDIQYFDGTTYRIKPEYIVGFTRVDSNGNVLEFIENPNSLFKDVDNYNFINQFDDGELSILKKDVNEMDNIFSKYPQGRYGVNQRIIKAMIKANVIEKIDLIVGNLKKYVSGAEDKEILKYLNDLDNAQGICDYAMTSNIIFSYFSKNKKKFKEIFGYDYEYMLKNGNTALNDHLLLSELHLFLNKDIMFKNGKYSYHDKVSLTKSFRGKKEKFKFKELEDFFKSKNIDINANVNPIYNNSLVEPWQYKPNLNGANLEDYIKEKVTKALDEGKHLNINISGNMRKFEMTNINGKKYILNEPHAMYITGIDDDKIILDSWGEKFVIPISDLKNGIFSIYEIELSPYHTEE